MSFRRNSADARKWSKWLALHRERLLACDVPLTLLEREEDWLYFLDHGYFTPQGSAEPIITIDRMDRARVEQLCSFLEQEGSYYPDCHTLRELRGLPGREA